MGRGHVGQGLGAAHRGLVTTELGARGMTTDHRGPGVARQGQRHGATAAGGAQDSPPGEKSDFFKHVINVMERQHYMLGIVDLDSITLEGEQQDSSPHKYSY